LPPFSPTYETVDLNSAAHVLASTSPVAGRPQRDWNCSTAPRVIGPKIPSSSTPTWRWIATTTAPVSPSDTSAPDGRWIELRADVDAVATERDPDPEDATATSGRTVGPAAIDAVTASVAPLRRAACLRLNAAISRRCSARDCERAQSSGSLRSRVYDESIGNDNGTNPLALNAYGVSCRARAGLRYAANRRRFAPTTWVPRSPHLAAG
jgi:hypothetical protein